MLCEKHKLHYSPTINKGCVLCRREAEPSPDVTLATSATVDVAVAGLMAVVLAACVHFALRKRPEPDVLVPAAAQAWGSSSLYARCGTTCATSHYECNAKCGERPSSEGCFGYCLSEADTCFSDCATRYQKVDGPWSYYYGSETMPDWSAVLMGGLEVQPRLAQCGASPLSALAYVEVPGDPKRPVQAHAYSLALPPEQVACAEQVLTETPFPRSELGDYAFLARFDSRYDPLKLVIAQGELEIAALARQRPKRSGDDIKSRVFEAKIAVSKQSNAKILELETKVKIAREEAVARHRHVAPAYRPPVQSEAPTSTPKQDDVDAKLAAQARAQEKRARELEEKNQRELERARRLNRELREREERARIMRAWESALEGD